MKKNIIIIVLSVLALLLAGTVGYLVAEKTISNKYENDSTNGNKVNNNVEKEEIKELDLNDNLVISLIYPMNNVYNLGYKEHWIYKNETIDTLGRSKMMYNATFGLNSTTNANYRIYSAFDIKNNFIKIFGPDSNYYDGDIEGTTCGQISKYDSKTNTYTANTGCGGATDSWIDNVSKKYKAYQNGEYIYVYEYVQSVYITPKDRNNVESPMVIYLLNKGETAEELFNSNLDSKYLVLNSANESNYESLIYQMMDRGEVDTYKWTFKKQSDGKYYFYSGAWEN